MGLILSFALLALMIGALVDIIVRDDSQVRHLPKLVWILLVILLPLIGTIIWFAVGHDWGQRREPVSFGDPRRVDEVVERRAIDLSDTEAQLAALEAEEKADHIRRLEAEIEAKRRPTGD